MTTELKITGRLAEVGNLDGGSTPGASIYAGDGRYIEVHNLTEDEARAIAPAFGEMITVSIALAERTTAPVSQDAETWLRERYGAARGHHAWRDLEEAFNAGRALLAAAPAPIQQEPQVNPFASTFPPEIWLNVGDGDAHEVGPYKDLSELTWSWESIDKYDVRYVRAGLAAAEPSPVVAEMKADTPEYTQYECHHCGFGITVHKPNPAGVSELVAWKVGNLVSLTQEGYPGMGAYFVQVWDGDDLVARVYGDSFDEVRKRAALVVAPLAATPPALAGSQVQAAGDAVVTPELLRHLQLHTGLGAHACADLAGGYSLITEIIEAAFKFRQPPQSDTSGLPG